MSGHAKFSPSGAKQWMRCPISWKHNLPGGGDPSESSAAAREGTIAHALGEFSLRQSASPKTLIGKKLTVELDGVIETVTIEKDMADYVAVYYEHCKTLSMLSTRRMIEEQVFVPLSIHGAEQNDLLWGTADFIAIADGERIDVVDLKYGGLPVEPENNPQCIAYLLGALELCTANPVRKAAVHIVQPRVSREPKIWEIEDVEALRKEWRHKFEQAIMRCREAALLTTPLPVHYCPGTHCRFCAVLPTCDAFAAHMIELTAEELAEIKSSDFVATDQELDKLAKRFENKSIVSHYYDELETYLSRAIRSGKDVPGFKLVRAMGNRAWNADDEIIERRLRAQKLKKADIYVQKLRSPAQIEKLLEKPEALEKLVTRKAIGERLVPLSDKRDAIDIKGEVEALPTASAKAPVSPVNAAFDEVDALLREQAENATRAPQSHLMSLLDLGDDEPHTADPDPDGDLELLLGETNNDIDNEETEEELIF